jgi:hypothetical protein
VTEVEARRPGAQTATSALSRLVALARALRAWILKLALAAAVAAAVILYIAVRDGFPSGGKAVLATIAIAAALAPPVLLVALWLALGELVQLPERVRNLPFEGRKHGEQLRRLVDEARAVRGRHLQVPRVLWRLTRLASSARETLTPYAPLLPFLSVPFLGAVVLAAVAAVVELLVACVLVLVLALG